MARVSYAFPLKYNPPAMRVRDVSYTKNHLSVIIEVFRSLLKKGKVILMAKQRICLHEGCVASHRLGNGGFLIMHCCVNFIKASCYSI